MGPFLAGLGIGFGIGWYFWWTEHRLVRWPIVRTLASLPDEAFQEPISPSLKNLQKGKYLQ